MSALFEDADVISRYSRREAIEDGILVAAPSEMSREAGLRCDVALTQEAWGEVVEVPKHVRGQDEDGRLWNVLWLTGIELGRLARKLERAPAREAQSALEKGVVVVLHVRANNRETTQPLRRLRAKATFEDGRHALTIGMEE